MSRHIPRFYFKQEDTKVAEGEFVKINQAQMHHAANVLRLRVGDTVKIFNKEIGEWECAIHDVKKCLLKCTNQKIPPCNDTQTGIIAAFSLINPARMSILLEKITEIGVTEIIPIISQYTQQRKFNKEKAEQILIGASEQSGRLDVPKLHEVQVLEDFLNKYSYECKLIVADEDIKADKNNILSIQHSHKYAFLVGPEGGFSAVERELFKKYDFVESISLGKNILRSETAAIVLASACSLA
jgi:16S rRNA (uracil1498-N3)-methyltransferase